MKVLFGIGVQHGMEYATTEDVGDGMKKIYVIAIGALLLIALIAAGAMAQVAEPQRAPVSGRSLTPDQPQYSIRGMTSAAPVASAMGSGAVVVPTRKTVKVALLLPLTGRNGEIGRALQNAASVALFDKYAQLSRKLQEVKVELISKDTGDSPELARKAAEEAVAAGAELFIGPVFGETTEVIAPIAAAKNIPVLSFSNNRDRAAPGRYMLGFSPQEQTFRVVNYALAHGKKRIVVLAPKSVLGDEVFTAARTAAANVGVKLVAEIQYPPQAVGLDKILGPLPSENGRPAFDAILIAEGGAPLETILRALGSRGVTPTSVQFLGTGLWDDVQLRRKVNLDGAWFASSPPELTAKFESRYQATYSSAPPRIASLAYDAVALAVALAVTGRPYAGDALTNPTGFMGPANGLFRMLPTGMAERGLAIIRIEGSAVKAIEPAPTAF